MKHVFVDQINDVIACGNPVDDFYLQKESDKKPSTKIEDVDD